jgi:hypothetical protein
MSSIISTNSVHSKDIETRCYLLVQDWRVGIVIIALAILQQCVGHLNGDVTWFMTFAEKYLSGSEPYADVSDPNPPAAFLAYAPAVEIARLLGLKPEFLVALMTFTAAGGSLFVSGRILRRAECLNPNEMIPLWLAALSILLFVPAFCFAEREHLALLAFLPFLAASIVRAKGKDLTPFSIVAAGLGAGICCLFKPHYLVPLAMAAIFGAWRTGHSRLLWSLELLIASGLCLTYISIVILAFPAYLTNTFPLIVAIYAPLRDDPRNILGSPLFLANFILLIGLWPGARNGAKDVRVSILAIASAGFLLTFLIQGKGWMNHAYPGMALALLASVVFLVCPGGAAHSGKKPGGLFPLSRRCFALYCFLPAFCVSPILFGISQEWPLKEEYPGLTAAVARVAPPHPKIAVLAEQLDVGHPLVRHLHGTWIGRQNCLWVSWGAKNLLAHGDLGPAERIKLANFMREDEAMFAEDLRLGRPDILLVETPALERWARDQPALARIFDAYHAAGTIGAIGILARNSNDPTTPDR